MLIRPQEVMARKIHRRLHGLILLSILLMTNAGCAYFHWQDGPSAEIARRDYMSQTNHFLFHPGEGGFSFR
jgi:hypothetical protein